MKQFKYISIVTIVLATIMIVGFFLTKSPTQAALAADPLDVQETAVSTQFSYQGRLKREGNPYTGTCDFRFDLWDEATNGTQVGTLSMADVPVTEGLFAVELDFGDQFQGEARWLAAAVQCPSDGNLTELGREPLTAVPYALGLRPGTTIESLTDNALNGIAYTEGRAGLVGLNYGEGGFGVYGSSPNGGGVVGFSTSWIGVYGETEAVASTGAAGVYGVAKGANGMGVAGQAQQPNSIGVKGAAHVDGGVGVWGESSQNTGVYGTSTAGSGVWGSSVDSNGVYGVSSNWAGVWGESSNASGVVGVTSGDFSGGLYGLNNGAGYGVYGKADNGAGVVGFSENGTAVFGRSTNGLAGDFEGRVRVHVLQISGGSDLAERFAVSGDETIEPGTVMVIDPDNPGHLMPSNSAYDRKVAGVVSGAGDVQPGLTLHQEGVLEGDTVVAIAGRVYVMADASNGAIAPGDLLTTSNTPGHVMKATDLDLAQGAIIGKAMTELESGTGLVLLLVNLQ